MEWGVGCWGARRVLTAKVYEISGQGARFPGGWSLVVLGPGGTAENSRWRGGMAAAATGGGVRETFPPRTGRWRIHEHPAPLAGVLLLLHSRVRRPHPPKRGLPPAHIQQPSRLTQPDALKSPNSSRSVPGRTRESTGRPATVPLGFSPCQPMRKERSAPVADEAWSLPFLGWRRALG